MNGVIEIRVPLAAYGPTRLKSRAVADSVLEDVGRAREIVLDFTGIGQIGPAFADEIFHVYAEAHPGVHLSYMNAAPDVRREIKKAVAHRHAD